MLATLTVNVYGGFCAISLFGLFSRKKRLPSSSAAVRTPSTDAARVSLSKGVRFSEHR